VLPKTISTPISGKLVAVFGTSTRTSSRSAPCSGPTGASTSAPRTTRPPRSPAMPGRSSTAPTRARSSGKSRDLLLAVEPIFCQDYVTIHSLKSGCICLALNYRHPRESFFFRTNRIRAEPCKSWCRCFNLTLSVGVSRRNRGTDFPTQFLKSDPTFVPSPFFIS